ncbi:MAG: hypothetical protein V3W18_09160 [candidate division Zixibacteria bacterium]
MKSKILLLLTTAILLGSGCSREIPNPSEPVVIDDQVPPTPVGLTAAVGDRIVDLSWSVSDTTAYTFRIHMANYDGLGTVYTRIGETTEISYTLTNLRNGDTLLFKVSAVNGAGFEGYKSDSVVVVPNSFSFSINGGSAATASRDVILNIFAPPETRLMRFSEDSTFADSPWEYYNSVKSFRLSSGDDLKTIYTRFRDSQDKTTAGNISASITLDTRAAVDSVTFSPTGSPFAPGDIAHFALYAGEPEGEGVITIGSNIVIIQLNDDGLGGDPVAYDGIYEADYNIAGYLDFESQDVFGDFVDHVDNAASRSAADNRMTVRRVPDPVSIYSITTPEGYYNRLQLAWNSSTAGDFAQYRIYRGTSAGVDSSAFLVRTLTSRSTTTVTDTGLTENTTYFYKVYVVDNTGLWGGSDEVSATSGQDQPPSPVTLYAPFATPDFHDRLELSWSSSGENDLLRYELYRSDDPDVDSLDFIAFSSQSQTSHTDIGLEADSLYYYAVLTRDLTGNVSWSNIVSERTNVNTPPEAVTLFPVITESDYYQEITIDWSESSDNDFHSYRLYRWREDLTRSDSSNIALISESGVTSFIDSPPFDVVPDTVNFWYILHLYDEGGNSTASDSVRVHLIDSAPPTVPGLVSPTPSSLIVSWNLSEIPDFGNYRLLRDTDSDPAGAITVYVSTDQDIGSFEDLSATQGVTYFYWLDIYDRRDNSSRSLLGSGSW